MSHIKYECCVDLSQIGVNFTISVYTYHRWYKFIRQDPLTKIKKVNLKFNYKPKLNHCLLVFISTEIFLSSNKYRICFNPPSPDPIVPQSLSLNFFFKNNETIYTGDNFSSGIPGRGQ